MYNAPIPLGPYILWPEILNRSILSLLTSIGILPTDYAASVWKNVELFLHISPIFSIS